MQKTMKKLLSIILAILMIVTTVPMAFAAEGETRTLYVKEEVTGFNFGYEYWFVDADGNDLNCTYEDLGDNWYKYTVPVSAAKYYMWKGIGGGDSYPYEPIPEKVDTLINRNGEAEWYCSHQMNTSGEQNCKGFLCEICGETYGEADLSAHKIKDGICEVCGEADSDAPLIIDVTDEAYVSLGERGRFYDKDGYIITGTNENCDINVYESSNITLRNLSAQSMGINSTDGVFVTINLEGINELAEDLSFYKDHIIFEGSDDAVFKADCIYNGGNSEASVTLNGGNIVLEAVSYNNYTVYCGKLIINGGTLTASNDSDAVIGSSVKLNGGELNIISTSQQFTAIWEKITMKKGALLTVSAESGILSYSAEITVADELAESDNFFVRYDTESEFVPVQDIEEALDGKTYAEIKVDTHVHSYEDSNWSYSTEKHWKECTCGEIDGEAEHTFTDGKCDCGYECVHANYADGACDNCDVKQKYTVRMETKLSEGVEFVGNPVAIHGEDLIIEFKNLVSEKCNDVSLFKLTIGANSFYEFEFDENGITFDGTVLTIPGELVNGDVETHANAYTQARIKLNGGKFSPECPPDIVEEYFIENDYAISNKMLVGYTNSVKDTFVKDKHTIKSILASDGNDYNKIYYFSPNSDLEMTIEWECLPENFENGVCVECGYECSHEKYTDGVCDVCGYKCPHEWVGVAFAKPTRTEEGYYTYTCSVCKSTKTEPVERPANYAEFKELIEKVKDYLDENLTDSMMQEVKNVINFFELDENHGFIKGEENTVSQMIRQISGFVEVVEEGIADGTAVKVDGFTVYNERGREWLLKFADEGIFEKARELILNSTEVKAKMDEIYDFALSLEGNVAENAENIAKIEADVDEFFGQLKKCIYGIHNVSQYKEISPAKCGENAIESATCTLCGETVTREVENSALTHSFTKYEETEAPKCGVEGKEVAVCDNGCGETDEKAIEALRHSFTKYEVTEEAKCGVEGKKVATCDNGCGATDEKEIEALKHLFLDYIYNEDATCTADGTRTATCIYGCGETDTVTAEDTMLNHADEDGDGICDDCETEIKDVCPDCGGPAHEETGVPQYICMLITLIKLVVSLVKALQAVV